MVFIASASSASASSTISYRFNTDTGSNYYVNGASIYWPTAYAATNGGDENNTSTQISAFGISNSAANSGSGYLIMTGANSSGVKIYQSIGGAYASSGNNGTVLYFLGGYYNSASTISSVSIFSTVGNFDAGTVYVYTSA